MNIISLFSRLKLLFRKNLVIKGTLILTIAGFSTRIIGFYNRIFLSGLIGAKEMGIYQLIFPLYMVAFSLTTCGNELALTKLVSSYKSRGDMCTAKAFFKACFGINLALGLTVSTIMYKNADWLCIHILNAPECTICLKTICFGIPFMAMKGSIHGYFLGLEKSSVHGISDFLEQTAKVLGLYLLATYVCIRNQYDASFAVWGIVIGEIVAFLYSAMALMIHNRKRKQKLNKPLKCSDSAAHYNDFAADKAIYPRQILHLFFKDSVPLTTNRLALTILQSFEAIIIPTVLLLYYKDSSKSLATYGVFSGMAFPFIMFPSTITNSLSTMLLPAVSSASSTLNQGYLSRLCEKSLHFCLLIGMFSTITFYIFGPSIGQLFFQNKEAGIYLYQLSFLCPLIYLATTLASILNGLGLATHNLILTFIATIIRIGFIKILIPEIGITGYIIGLFTSYLFLTIACLHKLEKIISIQLHFLESIFLPGCVFTVLGTLAFWGYKKSFLLLSGTIPAVIILIGVIALFGIIGFLPFLITIYKAPQQPH